MRTDRIAPFRSLSAVAGLLAVFSLLFETLAVLPALAADPRDEAAAAQALAEQQIEQLKHDLEGIDASLANLYIEMETVNQQLPVVETQLLAAEQDRDAASREYEQISDQLTAAEAEAANLQSQLGSSKDEEAALNLSIGEMVREQYRGGVPSALDLVMTADSAADISDRTAAASNMARAQSNALQNVQEAMVQLRNQADKQSAVTLRITDLEASAAKSLELAEVAESAVSAKHDELSDLQVQQETAKAAWDAKKGDAATALAVSEKEAADAAAIVAKIDQENQASQQVFTAPETTTSAGSSTGSGAMFQSPIRIPISINSPFGWRIHPIFGTQKLHSGTDMAASCGLPQYAIREGVVASIEYDSGGGNMVYINHGMIDGSSWTSIHMHLESWAVAVGQSVNTGTIIGYTGTTGNSTGCHVHLSLLQNGTYIDPMDYL